MNASKTNKDCRKQIDEQKVLLNNSEADYNNLQADLVSGDAVYEVTAYRAMASRVMAMKSRILSLPTRMARELAGLRQVGFEAKLRDALVEVIEELTEVTREELQDEAITMQEYPRTEEGIIEEIE